MTTTNFINTYMNHIPGFNGAHPCDILPPIKFKNNIASLIINLDQNELPGSHWVGLFFTRLANGSNICVFYDPLGHACTNKHILRYISLITSEVIFNKTAIQSTKSNYCGLFSMAFIIFYSFNNGKFTLSKLNNMYSKNKLSLNDTIVYKYIINNI